MNKIKEGQRHLKSSPSVSLPPSTFLCLSKVAPPLALVLVKST